MSNVKRLASLLGVSEKEAIEFWSRVIASTAHQSPRKVAIDRVATIIARQLEGEAPPRIGPNEIAQVLDKELLIEQEKTNKLIRESQNAIQTSSPVSMEQLNPRRYLRGFVPSKSPVFPSTRGQAQLSNLNTHSDAPSFSSEQLHAAHSQIDLSSLHRRLIDLSRADIDKCTAFGERASAAYVAGKKELSRSYRLPGRRDISSDPVVQAEGKLAELAFVRSIGVSDDELDWSDRCDPSYDVKISGLTIDVKSSYSAGRLMWPVTKNHFFDNAADVLVLVKVQKYQDKVTAELVGWIGRHSFKLKKMTSNGKDGLIQNTWYVQRSELNDITDLFVIIDILKHRK